MIRKYTQSLKFKPLSIVAFLILTLLFLGCHFNDRVENSFDNRARNIIVTWYDLFLKIERNDKTLTVSQAATNIARVSSGIYNIYSEYSYLFNENKEEALKLLNQSFQNRLLLVSSGKGDEFQRWVSDTYVKLNTNIHTEVVFDEYWLDLVMSDTEFILKRKEKPENLNRFIQADYIPEEYLYSKDESNGSSWSESRTFVVEESDVQLLPPFFGMKDFEKGLYDEALTVYTQSQRLTKSDRDIIEFWSDNIRGLTFTQVDRWLSIATQILKKNMLPYEETLEMYRDLGMSLYDASVISWRYKTRYNLMRPQQVIRMKVDADWQASYQTNSPSFPSAYAVFGSAAGVVLDYYFPDLKEITDNGRYQRIEFFIKKKKFDSLSEMYNESAYSRFLSGVHYLMDCEAGLSLGLDIGKTVIEKNNNVLIINK